MSPVIQISSELVLLFTAAWMFAGTFEPLRSRWRIFGNRPIKHWVLLGLRITTALAFLLLVVIIVVDVLDLSGFLSKGGGS